MPSADKMAATEVIGDQQPGSSVSVQPSSDMLESLRREAEQLKAKLEEERAKLTDVDRNIIFFMHYSAAYSAERRKLGKIYLSEQG